MLWRVRYSGGRPKNGGGAISSAGFLIRRGELQHMPVLILERLTRSLRGQLARPLAEEPGAVCALFVHADHD
jgi:hypothetical protein